MKTFLVKSPLALLGSFSVLLLPCFPIAGAAVGAGDIIVVDARALGGAVIKVHPTTGAQTVISSGQQFVTPTGIAVGPEQMLLVTDRDALGGSGAVFKINPQTGNQLVFSSEQNFSDPIGIIVSSAGAIYVSDANAFGKLGAIYRLHPATGLQLPVSEGGLFIDPIHIAFDPLGNIVVAEETGGGFPGVDTGRIIRVDPVSGNQTIVSEGLPFVEPTGVAVAANQDIFVADAVAGSIFKVDPATGMKTVVTSGDHLGNPYCLVIDTDGTLLVATAPIFGGTKPSAVVRVNPSTGAQTVVSSGGVFKELRAIIRLPLGDQDGDGVPDDQDQCPNTPRGAAVDGQGCSVTQLVPCSGPVTGGTWKNHGQFVSTLVKTAEAFVEAGLLSEDAKDAMVEAAACSSCGKKNKP